MRSCAAVESGSVCWTHSPPPSIGSSRKTKQRSAWGHVGGGVACMSFVPTNGARRARMSSLTSRFGACSSFAGTTGTPVALRRLKASGVEMACRTWLCHRHSTWQCIIHWFSRRDAKMILWWHMDQGDILEQRHQQMGCLCGLPVDTHALDIPMSCNAA